MHTDAVYVVGGGGHGKVVVDALLSSGLPSESISIVDDNGSLTGKLILGIRVSTPVRAADFASVSFHVAVGSNVVRERIFERIMTAGGVPRTVVHPASIVSGSADVGGGAFLAARCIVAPEARVGRGAILNHGCVVDHECHVGAFAHIAPNAMLGGCVEVGDRVLVGAGANLLPGVRVGHDSVIGAGAVVTRDVGPGRIVRGVPARDDGRAGIG